MKKKMFYFVLILVIIFFQSNSYTQIEQSIFYEVYSSFQSETNVSIVEPKNVLVVYNPNNQVSKAIKDKYVDDRNIPSTNIVPLTLPNSYEYSTGTINLEQEGEIIRNVGSCSASSTEVCDNIAWQYYKDFIEGPIKNHLNNVYNSEGQLLKNVIRYIVLCKGIPHKIRSGHIWIGSSLDPWAHNTRINVSVDALLCLMNNDQDILTLYNNPPTPIHPLGIGIFGNDPVGINPYYNIDPDFNLNYRFTTNHFTSSGGWKLNYLVSRLDGVDTTEIFNFINMNVNSDKSGQGVYILDAHQTLANGVSAMRLDAQNTYSILNSLGFNSVLDLTDSYLISNNNPVISYSSSGRHADMPAGFVQNLLNFNYLNGSVYNTYESFNAWSFDINNRHDEQSMISEFVKKRLDNNEGSGGVSHTWEPYVYGIGEDSKFLPAYAMGYSMVDAAYQGIKYLGWQNVVIGDPLTTIAWGKQELTENITWSGTNLITGKITVPTGKTLTIAGNAVINFKHQGTLEIQTGGSLVIQSGAVININVANTFEFNNSVTIPNGATLNINPGVNIKFASGKTLTISGTLNATGTPSNKITFNRSGTTGTWGGIIVSSQALASLSYCNISYAGYGVKYSDNNSASVYNCNISNCTYGIYSSQYYGGTVANNTITGCTTGIYIYNNRLSVYGNTITATNYGIYTYNNTSYVPYIYNNTISTNGSGIGIYCGPNTTTRLMTPSNGPGANTLQSNNIAVYAVYSSYPFLGSTNYPGYNRILNSTTYHIQLYMAGPVYAQYNWWGESTPDASKFYTNTGTIYYSPYLTSDPNLSLSTTTEGNTDGTMTTLSKNIASVSTLEKALNYELSGDYGNAMKIYKTTFEQELNSDIGRYCLTKIQICYDSLGQTDFDLYADKFVAGSLKNSDLGAARIELTNKKLLENRNYDQALKNMEAASANTNYSEEVRKINLYNIAMLYFNISNDVDKAKEVFAQFKEQYPNDRLNDDAEILLGSIFSAKLNKEAVSSEIVSETKLFDNYPNPFNPTTTINYSVKEAGLVKIKVYDILGREIEMLVNEVQDIGNHSVGFNASDLPSGVYIYTLQVNGFSDSKKMLLIK